MRCGPAATRPRRPRSREAVAGTRPGAAAEYVLTMDALLSYQIAEPRFYAVLVGCFAALALFLAAFGVYCCRSSESDQYDQLDILIRSQ